MKFNKFQTRKSKLENKIKTELIKPTPDINNILKFVDEYEKDNLNTIEKLRKTRSLDTKRINGAIKQTIKTHGPITMILIGSCTKRIMGALTDLPKKKTYLQQFITWIKK